VRRHPHVFGDLAVEGADEVVANWQAIKATERDRGGCSRAYPLSPAWSGLGASARELREWASTGPTGRGSREKVAEELGELDAAIASGSQESSEQELGDVLFALVNLARHLGLDPERALRGTADNSPNASPMWRPGCGYGTGTGRGATTARPAARCL
jgi:uncharacterized protein YabN with tetrapyrrole methylase and pyrophosphatase domain